MARKTMYHRNHEDEMGLYVDPRVNYTLQVGEKLVECPYEKSHLILEKKFVLHLTKCRHNYLNANKGKEPGIVICQYSHLHHVPKNQLEEHEKNCPTRLKFERETIEADMDYKSRLLDLKIDPLALQQEDEEKKAHLQQQRDDAKKNMQDKLRKEKEAAEAAAAEKEKEKVKPLMHSRKPRIEKKDNTQALEECWENDGKADEPMAAGGSSVISEDKKDNWKTNFSGYDPKKKANLKAKYQKIVLNPQGLTPSERRYHREMMSGDVPFLNEGEEDSEELPQIEPTFLPRGRDTRIPVGYPGWRMEDGNVRVPDHMKRLDK